MDTITLENFRCFRGKQTVRIAPLTLLVGENSTGKTSFMAAVRAIWDTAYRHQVPDFKEDPYDLGSFHEIAHHRGVRGDQADTFSLGFVASRFETARHTTRQDEPLCFRATFGKHGTEPIPVQRYFAYEDVWIKEVFAEEPPWKLSVGIGQDVWQLQDEEGALGRLPPSTRLQIATLRARDSEFVPWKGSKALTPDDRRRIEEFVLEVGFSSSSAEKRPFAGAPVRSQPRRTYDPARVTPDSEGDYVPMYLASMFFRDPDRWKCLQDALESFGRSAGLFDEIVVKQLGKRDSEPFQLQVRKFGSKLKGPRRNLMDVGYGVSQILPLITELLRQSAPSIFLLQQPEVHLHPSAQAALGSLFCQVAAPDRQLIVETHSAHLMDRVRMDVRDGNVQLNPSDVSILFFELDNLEVRIHPLRIDNQGNILGAPHSYRRFFMEETRRSLGI